MANITAKEVITFLSDLVGPLGQEEGLLFGDENENLSGMCICWTASPNAIEFAHSRNADFIICHEELFMPAFKSADNSYLKWNINRKRVELLTKYNMKIMRLHCSLDKKCIFTTFAKQLGLTPKIDSVENFDRIFEIPEITVSNLLKQIKQTTGLKTLRISIKNPNRKVTKIGLPWGGMALFVNVTYIESLIAKGAEILIAGETDAYSIRASQEAGVDIIETSHEISENEGLNYFANELKNTYNKLPVCYYENSCCWDFS